MLQRELREESKQRMSQKPKEKMKRYSCQQDKDTEKKLKKQRSGVFVGIMFQCVHKYMYI